MRFAEGSGLRACSGMVVGISKASSVSKSAREIILELPDPEDGSTTIFRNVGATAKHMTSHPRKLTSSGPIVSFREIQFPKMLMYGPYSIVKKMLVVICTNFEFSNIKNGVLSRT